MDAPVTENDHDWRRWSLAGIGPLLLVIVLGINTRRPEPLFATPAVLTYPIAHAVVVTASGVALSRTAERSLEIWRITRWVGGVTVVFAALGLWSAFLVRQAGGPVVLAIDSATAMIATGATTGVVVGAYDRRRRQQSGRTTPVEEAVENVTERVARRDETASTTTLLSTLVENLPVGVLAEDSDRRVLFTNQRFCELFGIETSPDELVGDDCEAAAEDLSDLFVDPDRFIERTNDTVASRAQTDRETYELVDGRTLERTAVPVDLDRETAGHLWVYHDVTDRTEYEHRLNALHETTRELMRAPSPERIATHASEAAGEILELSLTGVHLYDGEGLVPVAWSPETERLVGVPPTFTPGDSVAWQTFETGTPKLYSDVRTTDAVHSPETPIRSEIHLPLGEHGVFLVGETTPDAFDHTDVTLAKILATNVEAALDRAEREQSLRERETQLERERDRFATLFEHIPDPTVIVEFENADPIVRSVNTAFEDVFGYGTDAVVGVSVNDHIVPPELGADAESIDEGVRVDGQISREVRRRTAAGEIREFLFRSVPIPSEPDSVYGIYTDITDRKRRERTLEALNEVSRGLIRASTSARVCEIAVAAAENVLNHPTSGIYLFDEAEQALVPTAVASDDAGRLDEPELRYTDPDTVVWQAFDAGDVRVIPDLDELPDERLSVPGAPARSAVVLPLAAHGVFVVASPEPDAFDEDDVHLAQLLATTTAIALDSTEHERTLQRLHEATRGLMSTSDEQEIARRTLDAARDVLGFSLVSVRYLTPESDALVPVAVTDEARTVLGDPEPFTDKEGIAWEPLDTGDVRLIPDTSDEDGVMNEKRGIRSLLILPLGEYGTLNVASVVPDAFDTAGVSLARILAANVEAALDRAADERELRQRERDLRSQNEQLDQFASVLAHDLRNPLNVANGWLELIENEDNTDDVDKVRRAHDRMSTLIEKMLTIARMGRAIGETASVPVSRPASGAWKQVQTDAATLEIATDRVVDTDTGRLQQLFENLFRNAIEHGGADVTVRVGTLDDGTGFYVSDDGPGIPSDERDRIFDHGYSTADDGTGFGLSIVQKIVQAHGWTISVTDSSDGGTRFEIHDSVGVGGRDD